MHHITNVMNYFHIISCAVQYSALICMRGALLYLLLSLELVTDAIQANVHNNDTHFANCVHSTYSLLVANLVH